MSFKGDMNITDSTYIQRPCWYTHRDISSTVSASMVTIGTRIKVSVAIGTLCYIVVVMMSHTCISFDNIALDLKHMLLQRFSRSITSATCSRPESKECMYDKSIWLPNSTSPESDVYVFIFFTLLLQSLTRWSATFLCSYVAFAEKYTISMTKGFTIKTPSNPAPEFFDLSGSNGALIWWKSLTEPVKVDICSDVLWADKTKCLNVICKNRSLFI